MGFENNVHRKANVIFPEIYLDEIGSSSAPSVFPLWLVHDRRYPAIYANCAANFGFVSD